MPFPSEIRTPRLLLRRPVPADAPAIHTGYACDPEVVRYLTWQPHGSVEETAAHIAFFTEQWDLGLRHAYAIDTDDRPCVGGIELRLADEGRSVVFGYVLRRDHWGRGLMTEALRAGIAAAFAVPGVWRAWAYCDVDNPASGRVMEKAGMTCEGVLRRWALHPNVDPVRPRDCRIYAAVRDESASSR